jgi:hypothetical protein
MTVDEHVRALGLALPEPFRSPTGTAYPVSSVRVRGNRAYISRHLALQADGMLASRVGKSGRHSHLSRGRRHGWWLGDAWESSA